MKVVFEAFQGKLKSKPMDVPEETGDVFYMVLDLGSFQRVGFSGDVISERPNMPKRCKFEWTGQFYATSPESARIYQLVDID